MHIDTVVLTIFLTVKESCYKEALSATLAPYVLLEKTLFRCNECSDILPLQMLFSFYHTLLHSEHFFERSPAYIQKVGNVSLVDIVQIKRPTGEDRFFSSQYWSDSKCYLIKCEICGCGFWPRDFFKRMYISRCVTWVTS